MMDNRNFKENSVLVVDDDEGLTRIIATFLRLDGFEVSSAYNGLSGYASYFGNPTQFVVTDIQMPEWDGIEMVRSIRTLNPRVKIVYVSGAVDCYRTELERREESAGALFLEKPFTRKDLLEVLAQDFPARETWTPARWQSDGCKSLIVDGVAAQ
jgi:DNA-binding NtrC family response regulator